MSLNKTLGLIALVSIGLLLFGCAQPPASQGPGGAQQQATAGATQAAGQAQGSAQPTQTSVAGALGFEQLLASNIPTACDFSMTTEGKTYTSKIYFLNNQYRIETPVSAGDNSYTSIMISKNNVGYMETSFMKQMSPETPMPCDWLTTEAQAQQGEPQPAVSESQLKDLPPVDFKCLPAAFGSEKFDTPGKVCTYQEWMNALTAQMPSVPTS